MLVIARLHTSCLATASSQLQQNKQLLFPERCDSEPPVSPLKALEAQVLQRHVPACQTQHWDGLPGRNVTLSSLRTKRRRISVCEGQTRVSLFLFTLFCDSTTPLDVDFKETQPDPGYVFTANFLTLCCVLLPPCSLPRRAAAPLARGSGKSANQSAVARQLVPC